MNECDNFALIKVRLRKYFSCSLEDR